MQDNRSFKKEIRFTEHEINFLSKRENIECTSFNDITLKFLRVGIAAYEVLGIEACDRLLKSNKSNMTTI